MEKLEVFKKGKEILEALGGVLNRNNKKLFIIQKVFVRFSRVLSGLRW